MNFTAPKLICSFRCFFLQKIFIHSDKTTPFAIVTIFQIEFAFSSSKLHEIEPQKHSSFIHQYVHRSLQLSEALKLTKNEVMLEGNITITTDASVCVPQSYEQ